MIAVLYGLLAMVASFCVVEALRPPEATNADEATSFGATFVGAVAVGVIVGLAVGGVG